MFFLSCLTTLTETELVRYLVGSLAALVMIGGSLLWDHETMLSNDSVVRIQSALNSCFKELSSEEGERDEATTSLVFSFLDRCCLEDFLGGSGKIWGSMDLVFVGEV